MRPDSVAIVGAGWAGLSAALSLAEAGLRVTLFEAAPMAGGRARTVSLTTPFGRVELDNGQHLIVGAYGETLSLIERLAIGRESPLPKLERLRLALDTASGMRLRAAPLPAPLHLAWALATARGLGPGGRRATVRLMLSLRLSRWQVPRGESVSALLTRHRQPAKLVERLWTPLCIGALNTMPDEACAATFASVLRDTLGAQRAASDFMLPDAPLGALLPEPALARLQALGAQIRLRTPVRRLEQRPDGGWRLTTGLADDRQPPEEAARVLLALPPWTASRLLADSGLPTGRLDAFDSEAIATGWAFWPAEAAPFLPRWQLLEEDIARGRHGQWLFDRGLVTGPDGRFRLAGIVISVASRLAPLPAETVADGLRAQLADEIGGPPPATLRIVTERRATFRCTADRPRLATDHLRAELPGLWLAGDWLWPDYPATLEAAVRSGLDAAARLSSAS
jgi:squalene-associated FAD-dependent desaturase